MNCQTLNNNQIFHKTYTGLTLGNYMKIDINGLKFRFTIADYESYAGFANVILIDEQTQERFMTYGHLEVHGHLFTTYWRKEYSDNRDNYICTTDLVVDVV